MGSLRDKIRDRLSSRRGSEKAAAPREDLYDLQLEEVSVVDAGDNPGAHITLFKRANDTPPETSDGDGWLESLVSDIIAEEQGEPPATATTTTTKGKMTTSPTTKESTTRPVSEIMAEADRERAELKRLHPDRPEAALRQLVWETRPELREEAREASSREAAEHREAVRQPPTPPAA